LDAFCYKKDLLTIAVGQIREKQWLVEEKRGS
jgi:hypothetical protein